MTRRVTAIGVAVLLALLNPPPTAAQAVTDRVVVVAENVRVFVDGAPVDHVALGQVFVVHGVRDGWLWVRHRRSGWIEMRQVMPLGQDAVDFFTRLIAANPNSAAPYRARGNIWGHLGKLDFAIADYSAAIQRDPNHVAARINRGLAEHHRGNYDEAIANYDQALRLEASNPILFNNRGWARHAKGQFEKAIEDYTEAIRLDAKYVPAYSNRAASYCSRGEHAQALVDFDRVLMLDPYSATDYDRRAWLRATCPDATLRDGQKAVADATRACRLVDWKNSRYFDTLAAAQAEAGDFRQATTLLQNAIKLDGGHKTDLRAKLLEGFRDREPFRDGQIKNETQRGRDR